MHSRILLVDDEEIVQIGITRYLSSKGYSVSQAFSLSQARSMIEKEVFDAVLLDVKLPDGISLDFIQEITAKFCSTPVIVISGMADVSTAVQAMRMGATNFITKPMEIEGLGLSIQKCLEHEELKKRESRSRRLKKAPMEPYFGNSPKWLQIRKFADVASKNDSVVLLTGETGTGKGVLAKWIHENSSRVAGNYVELNCSALRGELLRSELYGHVRGSFTSALKDREGLIEVADNGTLFLDEIGDMELSVQAELLKTIEEKSFRRIGENKIRTSRFRLICATNKKLLKESETGKFRTDLYYRICVFPIELPALRECKEDISGFAENILFSFGYQKFPLDSEVLKYLTDYSWPGNIREMRNILERALLLAQGKDLKIEHFPGLTCKPADIEERIEECTLKEVERKHIIRIVNRYDQDLSRASKVLGISLEMLKSKLESYDYFAFA